MKIAIFAGLVLGSLMSLPAASHTLVLDTRSAPAVPSFAHDGKIEPIVNARVTLALSLGSSATPTIVTLDRTTPNARVVVPNGARAILVRYVGQNSGLAPDGTFRAGSKSANPDVTEVGRSEVETLAILQRGARLTGLPPAPLRLEPVGEIAGKRVGNQIQVRALQNGQPFPSAIIQLQAYTKESGEVIATTGPDGLATIAIPVSGPNLFVVSQQVAAPNDPDAHIIRRAASLSFTALPAR